MSTSVERAELLYDGGGSESPEHRQWERERRHELKQADYLFDAIEEFFTSQEILMALLLSYESGHDLRCVIDRLIDRVIIEEERRGRFDNWKLAMRDDYREEA